jgi:hypothetical protein
MRGETSSASPFGETDGENIEFGPLLKRVVDTTHGLPAPETDWLQPAGKLNEESKCSSSGGGPTPVPKVTENGRTAV